jgi:predicted methyltransferase
VNHPTLLSRRAAALPSPDDATVVRAGELCGEADLDAALARILEALPPGGRLVFVEHVGRPGLLGTLQEAWGGVAAKLPGGCHVGRDVPAAVRRAGFEITDLERFTMPTPVPVLRSWVSGTARKPAAR